MAFIKFKTNKDGSVVALHDNGVAPVFVKADGNLHEGPVGSSVKARINESSGHAVGQSKDGEKVAKPADVIAFHEKRNGNNPSKQTDIAALKKDLGV